LRAGQELGQELDLKASFALGMFATVFQAEVYDFMVLHLLGQSGSFIGVKIAHSVIEAGASVPELCAGTFYSK
jgi:hypothetical protein